jgi:hypothetical protein
MRESSVGVCVRSSSGLLVGADELAIVLSVLRDREAKTKDDLRDRAVRSIDVGGLQAVSVDSTSPFVRPTSTMSAPPSYPQAPLAQQQQQQQVPEPSPMSPAQQQLDSTLLSLFQSLTELQTVAGSVVAGNEALVSNAACVGRHTSSPGCQKLMLTSTSRDIAASGRLPTCQSSA